MSKYVSRVASDEKADEACNFGELLCGACNIAGLAADLTPGDAGHAQGGGEREDEGEDRVQEAERCGAEHDRDNQGDDAGGEGAACLKTSRAGAEAIRSGRRQQ